MSKTCQECGAKCCRYFCFEIDEPDTYEEFENVRWYLCHEHVAVHVAEQISRRVKRLAAVAVIGSLISTYGVPPCLDFMRAVFSPVLKTFSISLGDF